MTNPSILFLFAGLFLSSFWKCYSQNELQFGGIVRGEINSKKISLVFTGHDYSEGAEEILRILREKEIKGAFFLTGDFLRDIAFKVIINKMITEGHYVGPHSDKHMLYCSWEDREILLVNKETFFLDLGNNYKELEKFGIELEKAIYFLPPFEWYNATISEWTTKFGAQLINFTPGTRSNADYTDPTIPNYIDSKAIVESIWECEQKAPDGLNGFLLLSHIGVGSKRADKFYKYLPTLINGLQDRGYEIVSISELLGER